MTRISSFLPKLQGVKRTHRGYVARCPGHEDKSPSLSLKETAEGDVLLHCFAGCEFGDILAALGMEAKDCFADRGRGTRQYRTEHKRYAVESEVDILTRRYGLSVATAKEFVKQRLVREMGGGQF